MQQLRPVADYFLKLIQKLVAISEHSKDNADTKAMEQVFHATAHLS